MKKLVMIVVTAFVLFNANPVLATTQAIPEIEWKKSLGGASSEYAQNTQPTKDGGYIVVGSTYSTDGDVSGNHGNEDAWVVKLDGKGEMEWQKCLGGSLYDKAYSIRETNDSGYIIAGYTNSNDGDVSGNHGNMDAWLVKLDAYGEIIWQKCLGGSQNEDVFDIRQTDDGGYILVGSTYSVDGNVVGCHGDGSGDYGELDAWVVKLKENGDIDWQRCLGGSAYDVAQSIQLTKDGGYIIAGKTYSQDGDVSEPIGEFDAWIIKLKETGEIEWEKCLGGTSHDHAYNIQLTDDGGYVFVGSTWSSDGDVSGYRRAYDVWVVKLKENGDIDWQKCLGGANHDQAYTIQLTNDGGYIVAGQTQSQDGDVSGHHGYNDIWVVKLDEKGEINWQKSLGGTENDQASSIQLTDDGGYVLAGHVYSQDGDVLSNHGSWDVWIVKFEGNGDKAPASNGDASMNRPRAIICERTFTGQTLATFRDDAFGLLKVIDPETGVIDFRAPLRSEEKDVRVRISYADIQMKVDVGAKNLLIEYRGRAIQIPMITFECEELLSEMPTHEEAMIEIHLIEKEDGSLEKVIQLIVVEQVDEKTKLVHRMNVQ
ncbi:hypothetical protein SANA_11000 [Gottschalkiaceae bacterium SANA]|nr:hypothetical protein SANA_11000 [Gottschalkiaceae bacterium SANA]